MVGISILTMVYKPTYNWGGHHIVGYGSFTLPEIPHENFDTSSIKVAT